MDKITLEEMKEYAKEIIKLSSKVSTVRNKDEVDASRAVEIKSILYNDWCNRFESLELAKFSLQAIIADKDEWCRDDSDFLQDILDEVPMKDDVIYDLEATMLSILYGTKSDIEYF